MVESDFHATDGDYGCLLGDSSYIYLPLRMRKGENIPVSVCFLSMSEDLKSDLNGIDFELRTYKASLSYDYEIQKETNIEVELIGDRTT